MTEQRAQRVAEEIKREVSDILRKDIKDPRLADGFISVTSVDVTRDLQHAKIYVSVLGNDEEVKQTLQALTRAKGFLRTEIGKRIRLRHTPQLTVHLDQSMAYGAHINRLLHDLGGNERDGENE